MRKLKYKLDIVKSLSLYFIFVCNYLFADAISSNYSFISTRIKIIHNISPVINIMTPIIIILLFNKLFKVNDIKYKIRILVTNFTMILVIEIIYAYIANRQIIDDNDWADVVFSVLYSLYVLVVLLCFIIYYAIKYGCKNKK